MDHHHHRHHICSDPTILQTQNLPKITSRRFTGPLSIINDFRQCDSLANLFASTMYAVVSVASGLEIPTPSILSGEAYSNASIAVIILYYSTLWSIKLSFLIFFKRSGKGIRGHNVIWWVVLIQP